MRFLPLFLICTAVFGAGELSNRRAPGFSLPDSRLQQHDLQDYRGKVVVVEIIQTACPVCATFASVLEKAKSKYGDKIAVLSIVNPPDTTDTVNKFVAAHRISYPLLFDCGQAAASYLMATPQRPTIHLPHVFLIDGQGMIRNDFGHDMTSFFVGPEPLFAELDKLLSKR